MQRYDFCKKILTFVVSFFKYILLDHINYIKEIKY